MDNQDRLTKQLKYICEIANKIIDPHEQSFFLLTHVACLQAFTDVNKRTARLKKGSKKTMQQYIERLIDDTIPTEFQKECIRAIQDDLVNMGPERIHGLGITQQDLKDWMEEKK